MQNESLAVPILQNVFPLVKMPKLSEVELDKEISEEEYKKELRHLQKKLECLALSSVSEKDSGSHRL